jgi:D-alanyl-D-alanine carboxypeptidase/D-alanyl-D-alanine-endopeptidase (penicillin-binding protein 4)
VIRRGIVGAAVIAAAACGSNPAPVTSPAGPKPSPAVRELRSDLTMIFNAPAMARGVWGVDVRSVDTGEVLFQHNGDRLMMPASNMKILTVAAAAQTLGWDYRFTTTLETVAPLENGVIRGDVFVRSNGDPTINARESRAATVFDQWAAALREAGVIAIEGRIIGDDQAFDDDGVGPGWSWDYLEAGYAAPTGALQFNENTAELLISAGALAGEPAMVAITPGTGLSVVNRAVTINAADDSRRASVVIRRRIDRPEIEISGTVAIGAPPARRTVAVLNPTLYLAQAAREALTSRGIDVRGAAVDGDDIAGELIASASAERRVLARIESPSLRDIATVLMKVSQNLYAETLLKAIATKNGAVGTTDAGRALAIQTFTAWNIPRDAFVMSDGSGLSRYNYVTPSMVTTVLRHMYSDPVHRDAFVATLPIAGKDGTISTRMRNTRAAENAIAKTGSIANVRSLSGFVRSRDGEMLVFSIIANDFVVPAATVTYLADLAVETLSNFTRR